MTCHDNGHHGRFHSEFKMLALSTQQDNVLYRVALRQLQATNTVYYYVVIFKSQCFTSQAMSNTVTLQSLKVLKLEEIIYYHNLRIFLGEKMSTQLNE